MAELEVGIKGARAFRGRLITSMRCRGCSKYVAKCLVLVDASSGSVGYSI